MARDSRNLQIVQVPIDDLCGVCHPDPRELVANGKTVLRGAK